MPITLKTVVAKYLDTGNPARGTRDEYQTTLRKWEEWGSGVAIENLGRKEIREFLDWVYERAISDKGTNPGRTANKAREHLRAVTSWAWEQDIIESPPRFPKSRPQRDVAGRHYLTKAEIIALYFATHKMERPRGWDRTMPIGRYWRSALVVFFNYVLIRELYGNRRRFTSQSSGGTCLGVGSRQTGKSKKCHLMGGSSIAG